MADESGSDSILRYDKMVEDALRQVVRESLKYVSEKGLPGSHHFYITFRTEFPGVQIPGYLRQRYPGEMTIVLEHQFWDLDVTEAGFSVKLSFSEKIETLSLPFAAVTAFADPSVRFGLQFESGEEVAQEGNEAGPQMKRPEIPRLEPSAAQDQGEPARSPDKGGSGDEDKVVTLDRFRNK